MAERVTHGEGALMAHTRKLLSETPLSMKDISKATGVRVNWLWRFREGRVPDPGVNRVELIYTYITGKSLRLDGDQWI